MKTHKPSFRHSIESSGIPFPFRLSCGRRSKEKGKTGKRINGEIAKEKRERNALWLPYNERRKGMTTAEHTDHKIFYGWWVVVTAGIGSFMSYGPIIAFTFGVFIKPLSEEFGWSRTDISLGFSLSLFMLSGMAPIVGRLVDRFGARKVIIPSVFVFGSGVTSLAFLSASLWHFYAVYVLLGIVSVGAVTLTEITALWRGFWNPDGWAEALA